jgi:hypothetical protein
MDRQMREGVVDHQMVDVLVGDAGLCEGSGADDTERARGGKSSIRLRYVDLFADAIIICLGSSGIEPAHVTLLTVHARAARMFADYLAAFELSKAAPAPSILKETCVVNRQFKLNHVLVILAFYYLQPRRFCEICSKT